MIKKPTGHFARKLDYYSENAQAELDRTRGRKWGKEILACTLAAATPLAMAPAVKAAVQYSGLKNIALTTAGSRIIDVDGNGVNDFEFIASLGQRELAAVTTTQQTVLTNGDGRARNLISSYLVSSARHPWRYAGYLHNTGGGGYFNGAQGYIGIMFRRGGQDHFGWIEYKGDSNAKSGVIIRWAWEDLPNTPIKTGDIGSGGGGGPGGSSESSGSYSLYLAGGDASKAYRMVAMPFGVSDHSASAVIGPSIGGAYNTTLTRFGRWNTSQTTYDEYPNFNLDQPGYSFWAISRYPMFLNFSGTTPTLVPDPINGAPSLEIPLCHGWNQVGNGLLQHIDISQAVVENASSVSELLSAGTMTQGIFWGYNGDYSPTDNLKIIEGGWVKYTDSGCGRLYLPNQAYVADKDLDKTPVELPADVERPPAPPGAYAAGVSGGANGGGGGGGCFFSTVD